jgi:hypothetical protein
MIMKTELTEESGLYFYAIADAAAQIAYPGLGINGSDVYAIAFGAISAVVSDISEKRIRPERRHLSVHHAVTKRMMQDTTILPVSFGTIASGVEAIVDTLKENKSSFTQQLDRVRGKVEMGLRVVLDISNIFEYLVSQHQELADLRDELLGKSHGPSQNDKIELGRQFDKLLTQDRERYTEMVLEVLDRCCIEIKQNSTHEEREVMNLACLIDRAAQAKFEDGVFAAASKFDNNFSFDFNGPWAPHNFVSISLPV